MRLAGSVAWPVKQGRQVELTRLVVPEGAQSGFVEGQIANAYPHVEDKLEQSQPENRPLNIGGGQGASALFEAA